MHFVSHNTANAGYLARSRRLFFFYLYSIVNRSLAFVKAFSGRICSLNIEPCILTNNSTSE